MLPTAAQPVCRADARVQPMTEMPSLLFWLIAAAMAGIALAFVLPRLLSGRAVDQGGSRQAQNLDVYRAQLADLQRERNEGTLDAAEFARNKADVERRLLEDARAEPRAAPAASHRKAALAVALVLPVAAFALYRLFGTPAALDPAVRVPASEDPAGYRASLARHLERHPADARSWVLLARAGFEADRFGEAADAYRKAIAASPRVARDPDVLCELADALGMTQGGELAGQPSELIAKALAINPAHAKALEMAGSAAYERNDYAAAAGHWRALLTQMPTGTRERAELAAAIGRADALAQAAPTNARPAIAPATGAAGAGR
jgi:cytochrome c-type biogenesis protein CcmH